jgi:ArsR family transcriptional regulator
VEHIVQIFKALADETRLKILIILAKRRICAKGIAKHLEISEAAVSQHLKVLKEASIIVGEKVGYYVHYDIQEPVLSEIIKFIEQMQHNQMQNGCKLNIHIPEDCNVKCKASQDSCCHKNKD